MRASECIYVPVETVEIIKTSQVNRKTSLARRRKDCLLARGQSAVREPRLEGRGMASGPHFRKKTT